MSLLNRVLAEEAVLVVLAGFDYMVQNEKVKRGDLHIVIANPYFTDRTVRKKQWIRDGILYEHSVHQNEKWEFPYDDYARSKCYQSWLHQRPSQELQTRCPHLLKDGDTHYYGGAYCDGLATGCSGVEPWYDQMFSEWTIEACRAQCIKAYAECVQRPGAPVRDGGLIDLYGP